MSLDKSAILDLQTFKFVPLVVLRHLMDISKLGKSIVHTFVRLALHLQRVQESGLHAISQEISRSLVKEEASLLDHSWGRLNTGN